MNYGLLLTLLMALLLCPACSGPIATTKDSQSDERTLEMSEAQLKTGVITAGGFGELKIGQTKRQAAASLTAIGARHVRPGLVERTSVSRPEDLHKLRDAEAIDLSPGSIVVTFSGDRVETVDVAPIYSKWREAFTRAKTRQDALDVFAKILSEKTRRPHVVRRREPEQLSSCCGLIRLSEDDWVLLSKYDLWTTFYDPPEGGFWRLKLKFSNDRLVEILTLYSPWDELP